METDVEEQSCKNCTDFLTFLQSFQRAVFFEKFSIDRLALLKTQYYGQQSHKSKAITAVSVCRRTGDRPASSE